MTPENEEEHRKRVLAELQGKNIATYNVLFAERRRAAAALIAVD